LRSTSGVARGSKTGSPNPIIGLPPSFACTGVRNACRLGTDGSVLTAWRLISHAASR
jgi:hypothetical protein